MSYNQINSAQKLSEIGSQIQTLLKSQGVSSYDIEKLRQEYAYWQAQTQNTRTENSDQSLSNGGTEESQNQPSGILRNISDGLKSFGKSVVGGLKRLGKNIKDCFVSQLQSPANPNEAPGLNANCGPTSLLMALKMFGKIDGGPQDASSEIKDIREKMGGGKDPNKWTDTGQIAQGAQAFGVNATSESGKGIEDVKKALQNNELAIVRVNPAAIGSGPDTSHFVLVTGINGDQVTLGDPIRQSPTTVSTAELAEAMKERGGNIVELSQNKQDV